MKITGLTAITLATFLASTPLAWAQTATTSTAPAGQALVEIDKDDVMVQPYNMTVDDVEDMDIVDANGKEIAEVDEVLGTADGTPTAVSVDVGGFLGIGSKEVIIGLDQLTLAGDKLTLDMTKEQVEALPVRD
ncbi:hypothetical protein FHS85_003306 [Rhodoligotrophos appendicifer]|uniref:PRC-barrel domain-containing protein n=1 Tax=Rhodoligotrophos appendicifer TaxID=987056 RepID=UPI00118661AD|nr:PRC-barrel domain-containing protein [Rhodoligotrophos appendicifer]